MGISTNSVLLLSDLEKDAILNIIETFKATKVKKQKIRTYS